MHKVQRNLTQDISEHNSFYLFTQMKSWITTAPDAWKRVELRLPVLGAYVSEAKKIKENGRRSN